jgi:hypothetical protein
VTLRVRNGVVLRNGPRLRRLSGRVANGRLAEGRDVRVFFLSPLLDASLATQLLHRSLPGARQERLRVARGGVGSRRVGAPRGCESLGGHVDAEGTRRGSRSNRATRKAERRSADPTRAERWRGKGDRDDCRSTRGCRFRARGLMRSRDTKNVASCASNAPARLPPDADGSREARPKGPNGEAEPSAVPTFREIRERVRCKNETVCTSRNRALRRYAPQTRTT